MTQTTIEALTDQLNYQLSVLRDAENYPYSMGHKRKPALARIAKLQEELSMLTGDVNQLEDRYLDAVRERRFVTRLFVGNGLLSAASTFSIVLGGMSILPGVTLGLGIPVLVLALIGFIALTLYSDEKHVFSRVHSSKRAYDRAVAVRNDKILKGEIEL